MIKLNRPLRAFEIVEASNMNKTRVHNNLNDMLSKGSILIKEMFNKYYYPQRFFLDSEIMGLLYEKLLSFIKIIHTNTDYSQLGDADNKKSIMENFKLLLRLFGFEIEDAENEDVKFNFESFWKEIFIIKEEKERQSRIIPKSVQREVWRRDEGRCVECKSKEKIEFDHIIPFSRGGNNTVRNIQLLCESCNRKKSNLMPN